MVLVIDNYDSFTYNIVQYLGEMNVDLEVRRNDQISLDQIRDLNPERILVSPGPCSPRESGLSNDIIRTFGPKTPLFGVCLGHQCIGYTFGGEVIVNYRIMHGKTSQIKHDGRGLFKDMPNPVRGNAVSFAGDQTGDISRLPGNHRRNRRGRNHGCPPQGIPSGGRAIPS